MQSPQSKPLTSDNFFVGRTNAEQLDEAYTIHPPFLEASNLPERSESSEPAESPGAVYVTYPTDRAGTIDLIDLMAHFWNGKWLIMGFAVLFAAIGAAYAFLATPTYRVDTLLAPNEHEQGRNIPAGLGGLASLAGISLGSPSSSVEAVATLSSRAFVEDFINDKNLLPVLFEDDWDDSNKKWIDSDPEDWPDIRDGVDLFVDEIRTVNQDASNGLVTLSIEWSDPEEATEWSQDLIQRINDRLRTRDLTNSRRRLVYLNNELEKANLVELRQAISSLIENEVQTLTLAQAEDEYAFKVIDPPRVPKDPVAPLKVLVIALATLLGGIIGSAVVLFKYASQNRQRNTG